MMTANSKYSNRVRKISRWYYSVETAYVISKPLRIHSNIMNGAKGNMIRTIAEVHIIYRTKKKITRTIYVYRFYVEPRVMFDSEIWSCELHVALKHINVSAFMYLLFLLTLRYCTLHLLKRAKLASFVGCSSKSSPPSDDSLVRLNM